MSRTAPRSAEREAGQTRDSKFRQPRPYTVSGMRCIGAIASLLVACLASSANAQSGGSSSTPLTVPIGGEATLAIGGFVDAAAVHRSVATGSGLGTSFGAIPFENTVNGQLDETLLSAQNSRFTLAAAAPVGPARIKGYLEADFLGTAPAGLNVTSNSNTLRMRVYWMQYRRGVFEFVAGQAWSLITPLRNGVSPDTSDVFFTQVVDSNYQAGLTWARTMQFRFAAHLSDTAAVAVSVENPDQYVGSAVVLPKALQSGEVDTGGLTTDVPDKFPDVIAKIAFDPRIGARHHHLDVGFVVRQFRTYDPAAATTRHASGGGAQATFAIEPSAWLRLVGTAFVSTGGGRYLAQTNLPDFVVNPDASIQLVNSNSLLGGAEARAGAKTHLWAYYSDVRTEAHVATDVDGNLIGFGVPGSTTANARLAEATAGATYTFFRDAKAGAMELMVQYSHLRRTPFAVPAGLPADAAANLFYVNVRYALP